ncbi:sensor histidine kinase [Paractinoplanes durhamensis]|uniref:sensor histidine kinase n=1 Tax=Paractinoplanes durhamensis TaxID=113563 RepID=UPI003640765C
MLALFGLQIPGAGAHALTCLVYIAAFGMISLPLPVAIPLAVVLTATAEALPAVVPGWDDNGYGLAVLLGSLASGGFRLAAVRQGRLTDAQQELADLAVQNERARIAADLHDILGHSLTVVTVKAELAQRLLDVDLERARRELADLESLARDALADVRSTAMGVRGISLPGRSPPPVRPWPPRTSRPSCRGRPTRSPAATGSCSPGRSGKRSPTSSGTAGPGMPSST